ncbi:MAG: 30S ribosomal protein S1 [Peptostreptococcales bacterium]
MSEENFMINDADYSMEKFIDEIETGMKELNKGDIVKGTVISVNDTEILVNIGHISDGIIDKSEITNFESHEIKEGDVLSLYVVNPHDKEGNILLSEKRAKHIVAWHEVEDAYNKKSNLTINVAEVIKGGVTAYYKNIRGFIPGSLLSYKYVQDMNEYVGQELEVKVEEFDTKKNRIVFSRKAVEVIERNRKKKETLNSLVVGKKLKGVVTKLMKFGAFVDIGGIEGLIYIDDLSWNRVKHPSEVVKEGDAVEVYVVSCDAKTEKISLSLKSVEDDPWYGVSDYYRVNDIVEVTVVRLVDFGAFVSIEEGVEGLVHISEISQEKIKRPSDVLKVGDKVEAVILTLDEKDKKMSLSIKKVDEEDGWSDREESEEERRVREQEEVEQARRVRESIAAREAAEKEKEEEEASEPISTIGDLFGDKLKNFFKE